MSDGLLDLPLPKHQAGPIDLALFDLGHSVALFRRKNELVVDFELRLAALPVSLAGQQHRQSVVRLVQLGGQKDHPAIGSDGLFGPIRPP